MTSYAVSVFLFLFADVKGITVDRCVVTNHAYAYISSSQTQTFMRTPVDIAGCVKQCLLTPECHVINWHITGDGPTGACEIIMGRDFKLEPYPGALAIAAVCDGKYGPVQVLRNFINQNSWHFSIIDDALMR